MKKRTKKYLHLFYTIPALFVIAVSLQAFISCSDNTSPNKQADSLLVTAKVIPPSLDSFEIHADFSNERLDTLFLSNSALVCNFNELFNCNETVLDTFYLKGDTLNVEIGPTKEKNIKCVSVYNIYIRLKNVNTLPKILIVNGEDLHEKAERIKNLK